MGVDRSSILSLIHEIAHYIDLGSDNIKSSGLYGEDGGCLLFLSYYDRYFRQKGHSSLNKYLDYIFQNLSDGIYLPSYGHGVSGIFSLLHYLQKNKFLDIDIEEAEKLYFNFLYTNLKVDIEDGNYDFLHGALGILYFFLFNISKKDRQPIISEFLDNLLSKAIITNNSIFWNDKFNNLPCNISLAHGMSSITLILSYIYRLGLFQKKLKSIINLSSDFILSQKIVTAINSCYPNINLDDKKEPRLAWCYGDLGIGIALWQVGFNIQRNELMSEALRIFKFSEARTDPYSNRVQDACFCHGASGIAQLYRRMYYYTRIKSFLKISDYWINETVNMSKHSDGLAGFKSFLNGELIMSDKSLIDGIAGIGMVLMSSLLHEKDSRWDSLFLLSMV